jgi:hypothetical protein
MQQLLYYTTIVSHSFWGQSKIRMFSSYIILRFPTAGMCLAYEYLKNGQEDQDKFSLTSIISVSVDWSFDIVSIWKQVNFKNLLNTHYGIV